MTPICQISDDGVTVTVWDRDTTQTVLVNNVPTEVPVEIYSGTIGTINSKVIIDTNLLASAQADLDLDTAIQSAVQSTLTPPIQ